ncbi:MAG TPA: DUF6455 family protein [Alphaproteobacteria bacterium]
MNTCSQALPRTGVFHRLAVAWDQVKRRFATARSDARLRAELKYELRCLDEAGELDGSLANLGLSRAAIPVLLRQYPGSVRRYAAMARHLGVAAERPPSLRAGLAALFGPRRRCLFCTESRRCERWLATGARDGYRAFCPNADAFERIMRG